MKKLYKVIYYDKYIVNKFNCNIYVIAKNEKEALSKSLRKMNESKAGYPKFEDLQTQVILIADEKGNNLNFIII